MKKKVFSIFLVVMMVVTLFSNAIVSIAVEPIDVFVDEIFDMEHPDMFMDMVETFYKLSDSARGEFGDYYGRVITALNAMHQSDDIVDTGDLVYDTVVAFIESEEHPVTQTTIDLMRGYLTDPQDEDAFEEAFTQREITIDDTDVTNDLIRRGIDRLDLVFNNLNDVESLGIKIIEKDTSDGSYSDNSNRVEKLIDNYYDIAGVGEPDDKEEAVNDAVKAFTDLIIFYNNLESSDQDQVVIDDYLNDELFLVELYTPSSGGGGSTTPPPEEDEDDDFDQVIEDQDTDTASKFLEEEAASVETEEEAEKVLDNTTKLIDSANEKLSEDQDEAEEQIEKVASTINNISNAMDKIEDSEKAEEKASSILQSIKNMKTKAEGSGAETNSLDKAAENLANKVVEKAGTTTATSTKEGTKATADLSDLDITEQIQKAKSAADNMGAKLEENQIQTTKQKVETKVTINVDTEEDVEEVNVTVPNLDKAFETVDKVKVSSSVASFELGKDTIETQSDDTHEERINLNAKKLTAEELEEIKSNLSSGQSIPEGAQVINLTASVKRVNRGTGEEESSTPVTKFKQRIKVSVPYTLKEGENPKEVSVFLVQDDGTVKKVGGVYNPTTKQVEFSRSTFSNYYVAASRVTFDDTANLETMYKDAIEILAGKGLIAGKTSNLYDPDALVTRAEFTSLIARMLELEADPADLPFNDVDNDNAWYRNHLAGAYDAGIINGTSATTFHPQNKITRQEAAAIAVNAARFLGYTDADGSALATRYQDYEQIAPWAVRSVATVHRDKLAENMYVGSFMPKEPVTRDETAVLIYNMLFEY